MKWKQIHWVLLLILVGLASCKRDEPSTEFVRLSSSHTNIRFINSLEQTEQYNIIEYLYFYNGGGVSTGDINNDGLIDIYFTSNQKANKLYLNKGDFEFEDITESAGVKGEGNWKTGTTMADVNADGFLDIFICGVGSYKQFNGKNQLFINNGDLTFTERTREYGLDFQGFSTQSAFFDYDLDGDLDMYLLNHSVHTSRSYGHSRMRLESDRLAGDKLYRNELIPSGESKFVEVTNLAGIYNSQIAYGLGVATSDINNDGYPDIYVSNDFHENDYLYINQRDGTFKETLAGSIPHVSRFSMGNDIADINNDGRPEIITLDMLPKDEEIIKTTAGEDPYDIYDFKLKFGYHAQLTRNTLQLNIGQDAEGNALFSDIAPFAGIEATDWSWGPLLADFDNDGYKDLFISNGIVTRPNDLDYINFISSDSARHSTYEEFIDNMPSGAVANFFFRNKGDLTYENRSVAWTGTKPSFSCGASYADLDNDGDLDLVVNNVNDEAGIYRNDVPAKGNWLQFDLRGDSANKFAIGSKIIVHTAGDVIYLEQALTRGWQSSVSPVLHAGVGNRSIDSVVVIWPDRRYQVIRNVMPNQRVVVDQSNGAGQWDYGMIRKRSLLSHRTAPDFKHKENEFNAFSAEKLIPHMASTPGPTVAIGDVNGDKIDDVFIGGGPGQAGKIFIQERGSGLREIPQNALTRDSESEDAASAFLDANGDGYLDLIVAGGGQELQHGDQRLRPRLYLNNGRGTLIKANGLPELYLNGSCIAAQDVDRDGDVDIFLGSRVITGRYGSPPQSYLLINDGKGQFSDKSMQLPNEGRLGMVTDAQWGDYNDDGKRDLLVVGEWMPVTILFQDHSSQFIIKNEEIGLHQTEGWWYCVQSGDFDRDGDLDFVAGNVGLNTRLEASKTEPVNFYTGDFDNNGGLDHLLTYFNQHKEYPFISRDQLVKQVPSFKRSFLKYNSFRNVSVGQILPEDQDQDMIKLTAVEFASSYFINHGGRFEKVALPSYAQFFPIQEIAVTDLNGDCHQDIVGTGNLYEVQPELGRYDSGYGLVLLGDGLGGWRYTGPKESGLIVEGQGRAIGVLKTADRKLVIFGRNSEMPLVFENGP